MPSIMNKPVYKTPEWWFEPPSIFLGTARNPHSQRIYDFWLIKSGEDRFSVTYRHGNEDHEYGSYPFVSASQATLYENLVHFRGEQADKDFVWADYQARIAALWYLAFNTTPLIPNENRNR